MAEKPSWVPFSWLKKNFILFFLKKYLHVPFILLEYF